MLVNSEVWCVVNSSKNRSQAKFVEHAVSFLVPGMELATDVCVDDTILASQGTVITQQIINKLINWDIVKVAILTEVVTANPIADPKVQQFINSYNRSVSVVQKAFDRIRETQDVPIETFRSTAQDVADSVAAVGNVIDQLYNLPPCDDYTFRHNVNVSAIAALIATWLKYPPESINAISLVGLLHDVGKSQLPPQLINKPYKLTPADYEIYKTHAVLGAELVAKIPDIAQSIVAAVRDHHEREDGTGYPNGLTAPQIHPYAKIIAVADLYDEALTINADEPGALSPYVSLEKLHDELHCVDAKTAITFINNMNNFLSGNQVALTDGRKGRVVFVNTECPSKSMVQLPDGKILDLEVEDTVRIHYIVR